jgi:hypothetical protein
MKYATLILMLLVSSFAFAGSLNLIWDYDYTNDTPCQAGQTTNCLSHFMAFHMDAQGGRVTDKTVMANPTSAGQVTGIQTGFFVTKNLYGTVTYYVVAVARNAAGAFVESDDASVAAQLKPNKTVNNRSQSQ